MVKINTPTSNEWENNLSKIVSYFQVHFVWLHIVFRKTSEVIPSEMCSDSKRKEKEVEQVVKKGNTVGEEERVEGERRQGD